MIPTFSTALDTGYLGSSPARRKKTERNMKASVHWESWFMFGVKHANASQTFLLAVDAEVDGTTQQEQEEEAAGDSSCNASNGRATQPVACRTITGTKSQQWFYSCSTISGPVTTDAWTTGRTWTDSLGLRRRSFDHTSFGDHPEPVRQVGVEGEDVCTAGRARSLLDGAKSVWAASGLAAITILALELWSFHLDVKPCAEAHAVLFCLMLTSRLINQQTMNWHRRATFHWSMCLTKSLSSRVH